MITICPQCQLSLAVSAADLRVAQGHVRCGRCASVFNALVSLYDSEADALAAPSASEDAEATQSRIVAVSIDVDATDAGANTGVFAAPERPVANHPEPDVDHGAHAAPGDGPGDDTRLEWLPAANDPGIEEMVAANDPIADEEALGIAPPAPHSIERLDIDLGDLTMQTEDLRVVPQLAAAVAAPINLEAPDPHSLQADRSQPPVEDAGGDERQRVEPRIEQIEPDEPAPQHARLWAAGSAVLALLLAGQWIHHQRETLVGWPALTEPMTRLYAAIGRPIRLRGDLRAYDVRQLGAVAAADAAGTLTVRASLRNLSPRPQPMPLLRVTLQDRYGNRIASRDLTAAEYQQRPAGVAPMSILPGGARLETSVQLVDPGGNAVGFELDVCLDENGAIRCASDLAATAER